MTKDPASSVDPPFPIADLPELETKLYPRGDRSLEGWEAKAPRYSSPSPGEGVEGAWFDVDAVVRVVEQLRAMPHTTGRWRGTPFEPEAWQVVWILAPVFGWKDADGLRIVNELWDETARKSGKTALSARLGLVLLAGDGEYGAEVYAAAGSKEQAGFAFTPAKSVAESAPKLKSRLRVLAGVIRHPKSGSLFRVLSKAGDLAHGANVHGALIDEIHVHKDRGLIDALDSGTGAREQPLIIYTTTANDGDKQTIYGELHGRAVRLALGEITDATVYVVIWCAEATDDPFSLESIAKANPNYPMTPSRAYIEKKIRKAQDTPSWLPTYKRLYLNIPAAAAVQASPLTELWVNGGGMVPDEKIKGKRCWGGLVCASTTDLSALCWVFRNPEGSGYWWRWRWFIPTDSLGDLDRRTNGEASSVWVPEKRLTLTEGGSIDLDAHVARITADGQLFDVQQLAYDPNGATGVVTPLMEAGGIDCVPLYATSSGSAHVDMERLFRAKEANHGGDPIAAWQVHHLRVKDAATGVVKIDRRESTDNVFGLVAAEMGLRLALMDIEKTPGKLVLTY